MFPEILFYALTYFISLNLSLTTISNKMISKTIAIIKICGMCMIFMFLNLYDVDGYQYFYGCLFF